LGILKQKAIKFVPTLPEKHQKAIDSLGYGLMNKIILSLDEPLWADFEWIGIAQNERGKFPYFYNLS
jgi:monoamine oxidase